MQSAMSSIRPSPRTARRRKIPETPSAMAVGRVAATARRIAGKFGLKFRRTRIPSLHSTFSFLLSTFPTPAPFVARRRSHIVIETFCAFPHNAATDETFKRAQRSLIFRGDKADRIANGMRPTGAPNAVDVILRVHWKIVVHHMRDSIHVAATRGDIGGDENTNSAGLEILQRAEP